MMIDILLSTYNGATYLEEQLSSIRSQSFTDWHLFVRDDGSADATLTILHQWQQLMPDRMTILSESEHLGTVRSFERLLQQASAPYVAFADQDDIWLPDKLLHSMRYMDQAEQDIGKETPLLICGDLAVVDSEGKIVDPSFYHYARLNVDWLSSPERLAVCNYVSGATMLLNRSAIRLALPLSPAAWVHDAAMALQILQGGGTIIRTTFTDVHYRQHEANVIGAHPTRGCGYYLSKIFFPWHVLIRQHRNYRQAHAITGMNRYRYIRNRVTYLLKR